MCVVYLLPLQFNGGGFGLLDHEDPVTPPPSEEHSWCGHLRPGKWVARPKYFTAAARKNERNSCHFCTFLCENKRSDSKSHFRQCQGSWSQSRRYKPVRGGGVVQGNMATWPIALICVNFGAMYSCIFRCILRMSWNYFKVLFLVFTFTSWWVIHKS